jgi:protein ImuB
MFAALYLPSLPGRATDARAQLMAVAQEFSPRVEQVGTRAVTAGHLLTLDVTGLGRWFENSGQLGEALRRTAADRGLAAHVAVAATRTAAVLGARGRAGLTVMLPGAEAARLAPLPLDVLTVWGTPATGSGDPRSVFPMATLKRWGLKTLGDLAALPAVELSERLGQAGLLWQRLARGEDLQPLVPAQPDERFEESLELEWPIDELEPLSFVLGRLLESLCARLERADRGVAVLHVRLDLVGRARFARALQLPAPMRDPRTLRTLILLDLESNPPPGAIDRVTVSADVVEGRVLQFSLLARALPIERLSTLLARLSALMGSDRVGAPTLVDSYRPGAFAMAPFTVPAATATSELTSRGAAACGGGAPRALNDALPAAVVRRFRQPIPARVNLQQGRPARVTSDHRHVRGGVVEMPAGPWRTSGEWWGPMRPREIRQVSSWDRDEWDVSLRDGARYVIFRDRRRDAWFIDGILD